MAAFTYNRQEQIKTVIRRLGARLINTCAHNFTTDELFQLYVKPSDQEVLSRVFEIAYMSAGEGVAFSFRRKIKDGEVTIATSAMFAKGSRRWLAPRYIDGGPVEGAPPELVAKLDKWCVKRLALGVEIGLVMAVFDDLNWRCASAPAVAFFVPSVVSMIGLIEGDESARLFQDKLTNAKLPNLPSLPAPLRETCRTIGPTVARALLLEKKYEETPDGGVQMTLTSASRALATTPWGTSLWVP